MNQFTIEKQLAGTDRLEWHGSSQPRSLSLTRRGDIWVASRCGVYLSTDAVLLKCREILAAYPHSQSVRFSVSEYNWIEQAEKRGVRL